jgi:hypothetical protein
MNKNQMREKVNADLSSETLFMFCKDKRQREKFLNFSATSSLLYAGIDISIAAPCGFEKAVVLNDLRMKAYGKIMTGK